MASRSTSARGLTFSLQWSARHLLSALHMTLALTSVQVRGLLERQKGWRRQGDQNLRLPVAHVLHAMRRRAIPENAIPLFQEIDVIPMVSPHFPFGNQMTLLPLVQTQFHPGNLAGRQIEQDQLQTL